MGWSTFLKKLEWKFSIKILFSTKSVEIVELFGWLINISSSIHL